MARHSCLYQPPSAYFLRIYQHHVDMFGGDVCCAGIVSIFDYLTAAKLEEMEAADESEGLLWVRTSLSRISVSLCNMYSVHRINDRIAFLIASGLLVVPSEQKIFPRDPADVMTFLLNRNGISELAKNGAICAYKEVSVSEIKASNAFPFGNAQKHQLTTSQLPEESNTSDTKNTENTTFPNGNAIKEYKEVNRREEKKPPVAPLTPKPENQENVDLQSSILEFTKSAYKNHRGAKIENLKTVKATSYGGVCSKLEAAEREHGREEFRKALLAYLDTDNEWLNSHRWPIYAFLKDIKPYLPLTSTTPSKIAPRSTERREMAFHGTFEPEKAPAQKSLTMREYLEIWNARVPEKQADVGDVRNRKTPPALLEQGFIDNVERICERAAEIIRVNGLDAVPWLNARYPFGFDEQRAQWNFEKLLETGFMKPSKRVKEREKPPDMAAQYLARKARERAEREAESGSK